MTGITMDGTTYDVRVVYGSLKRRFTIVEGQNSGTNLMYQNIRDVVGTKISYTMNVVADPANPASYDLFYAAISQPAESHEITMPYGQTVLTFDAYVTSGEDTYKGCIAGYERWDGIAVAFESMGLTQEA